MLLSVIAVGYVLFSTFVQRKVSNIKRVRELQYALSDKMKEVQHHIKNNSEKAIIDQKNKELQEISMESMKRNMKAALVILPLGVLLYFFFLPMTFGSTLTTNMQLLSFTFDYRTFFIILCFVIGLSLSVVLSWYDKRRFKKPVQDSEQLIKA